MITKMKPSASFTIGINSHKTMFPLVTGSAIKTARQLTLDVADLTK